MAIRTSVITRTTLTLCLVLVSLSSFSQMDTSNTVLSDSIPKTWTIGGLTSLGFSQMSFSNWSSGGDNSYSLNGLINARCNYNKDKRRWDNTLSLAYGFMHQQKSGFKKTDDNIELSSKYSYQADKRWFYSGMLLFKTQFGPGYDYSDDVKTNLISKFLAPAYLQASAGFEYRVTEKFSALFSPAAYKLTLVLEDSLSQAGAFGVTPGQPSRSEFGASVFASYKNDKVFDNVGVVTSLGLFSNYFHNPLNIDIDWQLLISMKINNYLSASISTQLLYDDDIKTIDANNVEHGARVQFKEVVSLGFQYKFSAHTN